MELHTGLWDEVEAFDFKDTDLLPVSRKWPELELVCHTTPESLERAMDDIELLATWRFEPHWYQRCPRLKAIFTPAAGSDWIASDPAGKVVIHHGTFHGPILAESLLGAILHMNRRMPALLQRVAAGHWDRDLQATTHLLRRQTVVIVGLGHIGSACARVLSGLGAHVIGIKRTVPPANERMPGIDVVPVEQMDAALAVADHAALLLPGGAPTDRFMNYARLKQLKKGAFVYNFGRGNSLVAEDLMPLIRQGHIAGAWLDVTEQEPLPRSSPLWKEPNVIITPHSSCVCSEYKSMFVEELIERLAPWVSPPHREGS